MLTGPVKTGGAKEDRTPDLLNAIQALSQLSYNPEFDSKVTKFLPKVKPKIRKKLYTKNFFVFIKWHMFKNYYRYYKK